MNRSPQPSATASARPPDLWSRGGWIERIAPWIAPVLLVVILYGRTTSFPFFYDEYVLLHPLATWRFDALSRPISDYWRPLWTAWMCLEYEAFGFRSAPMHLVNLAIHTVNALLVVVVLAPYVGRARAAATAMVWTLLAANATPIGWVSATDDLVATALVLVAIRLWLTAREGLPSPGRAALASLLWFLAMLSKEVTLVMPFAATAHVAWRSRRRGADPRGRTLVVAMIPLVVWAAYFALRHAYASPTSGFGASRESHVYGRSFLVILVARAFHYGEALVYDVLPLDLFKSWTALIAVTVLTALVLVTWIAAGRRLSRRAWITVAIGLGWTVVFSLHGSFNPLPRNLYVPTLGVALALTTLLAAAPATRLGRAAVLLTLAYLGMQGWVGQASLEDWTSGSLELRMHESRLLAGTAPMKADLTPAQRAYLQAHLGYDDVAALARRPFGETIWRAKLQQEFARRFGRSLPPATQ